MDDMELLREFCKRFNLTLVPNQSGKPEAMIVIPLHEDAIVTHYFYFTYDTKSEKYTVRSIKSRLMK